MSEDHFEHLRRKAAIWLPLMDGNPDSVRLLRQWIDEDLDGMPAVCLMAVKMVTGALSEANSPPSGNVREPGTSLPCDASNLTATDSYRP
jgi:hypothetical protein